MTAPVLIAEDDANIREVMRLGLAAQGYAVETVANGEQAIDYLKKNPARRVILDFRMPGMDGLETAQAVKSRWPALPIVLCTVMEEKRLQEFLGRVVNAYLPKPFSFQQLKDAVTTALAAV